ncbi:MAG: hypothetical protein KTR30_37675 [Saprospiraceae bacterium]|nr:hypothetical protein [Saprospiraceae bacterium]
MISICYRTYLRFSIIFLIALIGCAQHPDQQIGNEISESSEASYPATTFPADTTALWLSEGPLTADTVLIIGEGGPHNALDFEWRGETVWSGLPQYKSYYRAHILQSTMLNKQIYENTKGFSEENGELEADNSTEILNRAVRYFKERGKVVLVVGSSLSAWVMLDHISKADLLADSYVISSGRLKANETMVQYHAMGHNVIFEEDAKTIRIPDTTYRNPIKTERYFRLRQVKNRIKAAFGRRNYMELLADKDLSNVTYVYAENDRRVGSLTEEEVEFLLSRGAEVFNTQARHSGNDRFIIGQFKEGEMTFRTKLNLP